MYIFVNEELAMSRGKLGAQTGHAAVEAYKASTPHMIEQWELGGHYTKLIMSARSFDHLCVIERYLNDRGFETVMIIDEGRTEVAPLSATALGVEIVDRDDPHTKATFESFEILKDPATEKFYQANPDLRPEAKAKAEFTSLLKSVIQDPETSIPTLLELRKLFSK